MESRHWEKREAQTMQWTNVFWVLAIVWIALSSPPQHRLNSCPIAMRVHDKPRRLPATCP